MSGIDNCFARQCKQFFIDTFDKSLIIASFQVSPADAAGKQCITCKYTLILFAVECHAAGRMTWHMHCPERDISGFNDLSVG